jgi:zinc protease
MVFLKRIGGIKNRLWTFAALISGLFLSPSVWAFPAPQTLVLPEGLRVLWVSSPGLPMLDLQLDFPAGSAFDPPGKEGVAAITRALLETGVEGLDEEALAQALADTGAIFSGGVDEDRFFVRLRSLSDPAFLDPSLGLLSRLLSQPVFPETALERERRRFLAALSESLTRPDVLAQRTFNASIYPSHPYGREISTASLERIARQDLLDFHKQHIRPNRARLTLVGDVDETRASAIAKTLLDAWPQMEATSPPALPTPTPPTQAHIHLPHPSAQAHVLLGMPGMRRDDPDYFPLLVGNYIMGGGGFVSRLMKAVREERGLAYSVSSHLEPRKVDGPFQITLQTRHDQADEALGLVRHVFETFIKEGPSEEELLAAKDFFSKGFGLRLDSNRKVLDHLAMIHFYDLPHDWLQTYVPQVMAVTKEEIRRAFAARLPSRHWVSVIVGGHQPPAAEQEPLSPKAVPE